MITTGAAGVREYVQAGWLRALAPRPRRVAPYDDHF